MALRRADTTFDFCRERRCDWSQGVDDRCAPAEDRHVKLLARHADRIKLVAELEEAPIGAAPFSESDSAGLCPAVEAGVSRWVETGSARSWRVR
jgi:hypothetical protein